MIAQGTVLRIPGSGTVEHQLGRARGTHIATGVGQGRQIDGGWRQLWLGIHLAHTGISGRDSGLDGVVHGAPLVSEENPLEPSRRHNVAGPVRLLIPCVPQPQIVTQLMGQGQRLTMDGEVAGTGVSITDARRTVGAPHTDGGSTPHVTARLGVILVAAQHIEVGEDLIRIRDPALIQRSLNLRAIGFVSLTIAILVPFVHQHAVIHPVDPNVVGGQAAAHVRHYDGTVVPQVALALTREGDVAIGEADRLGGGDKQPHLLHQLAICQDLEPGLSFC
ncbi:hypothetical protein D3C80_1332440 [compost metagenome]